MAEYFEREALIAKFKQMELGEHGLVERLFADGVYAVIAAFPAADVVPVVPWVLPDEKLPPEGQDVLCWYEYFRFGEYNRMYQTFGIGYQFNGNWGGEVAQGQKAKVLAWMPLPKPPKMDEGERKETESN